MTLDARLDKLKAPEAANAALDANLDEFLSKNAQVDDSVQVAGIGTGLRSLIRKVIPEQIKKAPRPPDYLPPDKYEAGVEKLITPKVAADVAEKAEAIAPPLIGKPPDELFNWMRTGLPDDANK